MIQAARFQGCFGAHNVIHSAAISDTKRRAGESLFYYWGGVQVVQQRFTSTALERTKSQLLDDATDFDSISAASSSSPLSLGQVLGDGFLKDYSPSQRFALT